MKFKFNNHVPPKLLIIVGVLLIAAGISFGYFIAQYDDLEIVQGPAEQYKITRQTSETEIFEGWKLYRNSKQGLEFQYPNQFDIQEDPSLLTEVLGGNALAYFGREGKNEFAVSVRPETFNLKKATIPGDKAIVPQDRIKVITVDKKTAYRYSGDYASGGIAEIVAIPQGSNTVYLIFNYTPRTLIGSPVEYRAQILTTFRFTKK